MFKYEVGQRIFFIHGHEAKSGIVFSRVRVDTAFGETVHDDVRQSAAKEFGPVRIQYAVVIKGHPLDSKRIVIEEHAFATKEDLLKSL